METRFRSRGLALLLIGALAAVASSPQRTTADPTPNDPTAAGAAPPSVAVMIQAPDSLPSMSMTFHLMQSHDPVTTGAAIASQSSVSIDHSATVRSTVHSVRQRTLASPAAIHRADSITMLAASIDHRTTYERITSPVPAVVLNPPNTSTSTRVIGANAFPLYL